MARFLVTVNFTRNGVSSQAIVAVPVVAAANATQALNLAVPVATAWIEKTVGDVVAIDSTSAKAAQ